MIGPRAARGVAHAAVLIAVNAIDFGENAGCAAASQSLLQERHSKAMAVDIDLARFLIRISFSQFARDNMLALNLGWAAFRVAKSLVGRAPVTGDAEAAVKGRKFDAWIIAHSL